MSTTKKKVNFFESVEGEEIKQTLQRMAKDGTYNTKSSYSANVVQHPDNLISFVDKHMNYINTHPSIDPYPYVSNLRLMTRIR